MAAARIARRRRGRGSPSEDHHEPVAPSIVHRRIGARQRGDRAAGQRSARADAADRFRNETLAFARARRPLPRNPPCRPTSRRCSSRFGTRSSRARERCSRRDPATSLRLSPGRGHGCSNGSAATIGSIRRSAVCRLCRGDCAARVFDVECVSGWSRNDASRIGRNDCRPTSAATRPGAHRAAGCGRRLLAAAAIALITLLAAAFTTLVDASSPDAPTVEFRAAERTLPGRQRGADAAARPAPLRQGGRGAAAGALPDGGRPRRRQAARAVAVLSGPALHGPRLDQRPCGAGRAAPPRPAGAAQHRRDPADPHPGRVPARRQQRDRADRRRSRPASTSRACGSGRPRSSRRCTSARSCSA